MEFASLDVGNDVEDSCVGFAEIHKLYLMQAIFLENRPAWQSLNIVIYGQYSQKFAVKTYFTAPKR